MNKIAAFTIINTKAFLNELSLLKPFAPDRNTIPVLTCIRIDVEAGKIRMSGTDLDTTLICELPAETETPGAFCIRLASLLDAVKKAKDKIVIQAFDVTPKVADGKYTHKEISVTLEVDGSKFSLEGTDIENFPSLPEINGTTGKPQNCTVPPELFRELIQKTAFAATAEQSRFTLEAVSLEFGNDKSNANAVGLRMIATDGHRLAMAETKGFKRLENLQKNHLLSLDACKILLKILDTYGNLEIDDVHFVFTIGSRKLLTRKVSGNFPNYEMVLPKETPYKIGFKPNDVLPVVENALAFSNDRTGAIQFQPYYNHFVVKSTGDDQKTFTGKTGCDFPQNSAPGISVNGKYFSDVCKVADKAQILTLGMKDSNAQFEIDGENDLIRYKFIIMPCRGEKGVNDEQMLNDAEKAELSLIEFDASIAPVKATPNRKAKSVSKGAIMEIQGLLQDALMLAKINDLPEHFLQAFSAKLNDAKGKLNDLIN